MMENQVRAWFQIVSALLVTASGRVDGTAMLETVMEMAGGRRMLQSRLVSRASGDPQQ